MKKKSEFLKYIAGNFGVVYYNIKDYELIHKMYYIYIYIYIYINKFKNYILTLELLGLTFKIMVHSIGVDLL